MSNANPVLAEVIRGNWVENIHRGAICVSDADGRMASAGDVSRPIFPRSAIKSMQALAMFRSGAVEKFGLTDTDLALACASHNGEPAHVAGVQAFLDRIGCTNADLECGAHPPTDRKARKQLTAPPNAIHNNCSGKHAGMLAVAKALGADTHGYSTREHAVQRLVREVVEEVIGTALTTDRCGTDGCSIPTWAAPLSTFADGFARMATGRELAPDLAVGAERLFDAASRDPFLVRGSETVDTELMTAFNGRLMLKIGAEGVFCGALRDRKIGFALKIDDGNMKAAEVVVSTLLLALVDATDEARPTVEKWATHTMSNWRKIEVGQVRGTDAAQLTL